MKLTLIIFFSYLLTGVFAQTKDLMSITQSPMPQKFLLKNDFRLVVITTGEERFLNLIGPGIDTVIKKINIKDSPLHLGSLIGDFNDFFILLYPEMEMKIYRKQTGEILAHGTYIHEEDTIGAVYYIDHHRNDQLGLFDLKTMKIELFNPLETSCSKWWVCIRRKYLSEKQLTLDYFDTNHNLKVKFYNREP